MKHLYRLVVSLLLFVGFQSCVDEDGAGVPSPKSLIIEADEYTLDMTDLTTPQFIAFRWVDVGNATYTVAFTKASDSDTENIVTEVLNNVYSSASIIKLLGEGKPAPSSSTQD